MTDAAEYEKRFKLQRRRNGVVCATVWTYRGSSPASVKTSSPKSSRLTGAQPMGTGVLYQGKAAGPWIWPLHLSSKLRMSGGIPVLPLYAFVAWASTYFILERRRVTTCANTTWFLHRCCVRTRVIWCCIMYTCCCQQQEGVLRQSVATTSWGIGVVVAVGSWMGSKTSPGLNVSFWVHTPLWRPWNSPLRACAITSVSGHPSLNNVCSLKSPGRLPQFCNYGSNP